MATKSVWDHVNHILQHQTPTYYDDLEEADRKTFTPYMINRFISMNPDYLVIVNQLQKYYGVIPDRLLYKLYIGAFPKRKVYSKYIKADGVVKYEPWLVDVVVREFTVSKTEANTYLDLFHRIPNGLDALRAICQGHGIDPKFIKKIK